MKSGLRHVRYVVCVFILQGLDPVFFLLLVVWFMFYLHSCNHSDIIMVGSLMHWTLVTHQTWTFHAKTRSGYRLLITSGIFGTTWEPMRPQARQWALSYPTRCVDWNLVKKIEQDVLFYFLLAPIQMLSSSTRVLKRRIPCLVPCTMAVAKSLLVQSRGTKIPSSTMFIRKRSRSCFIQ